jgi:hypothetical protein
MILFSVFGSFSDSEEESNANGNSESENVPWPSEHSHGLYFPFLSEIFPLLYSYIHNVSRPKVFFTFIYTTITFPLTSFICLYVQVFHWQRFTGYILHAHLLVKFSLIESHGQEQWLGFEHGFL